MGNTAMRNEGFRLQLGHSWQQRLGALAAVFFTALLIGSLLLLLYHTQQSRTGGSLAPKITTHGNVSLTVVPLPSAIPTPVLPENWRVLATLESMGYTEQSGAIDSMDLQVNSAWSILYNCAGPGKLTVQVTLDSAYASQHNIPLVSTYTHECSSFVPQGMQVFLRPSTSEHIQVQVTPLGNVLFKAFVVGCTGNSSQCSLVAP